MVTNQQKRMVIGLYGVPGAGKSTMLRQLETKLEGENFKFFEGSEVIAGMVPGGLNSFKELAQSKHKEYRQQAIARIAKDCMEAGKTGIVTGHYMIQEEKSKLLNVVYTQHDLNTYTHILYLDIDPGIVASHCKVDNMAGIRTRCESTEHLRDWQRLEKSQLRNLCYENGILFSLVHDVDQAVNLVRDFQHHTEDRNLSRAQAKLDQIISSGKANIETMLIFDADKTLSAADTGAMFWSNISGPESVMDVLFSSNMGYSYKAFRQAMLLYEEVAKKHDFETICSQVAAGVTMNKPLVDLLHSIASQKHVSAAIITSGIRCIWQKVLQRYGLSDKVEVIGGGRIADGFVVTTAVKGVLVDRLWYTHNMYVWTFGDSVLDLDMLKRADQAIVVVGDEMSRSRSMDAALKEAIDFDGVSARQILLRSTVSPRLNTDVLPLVQPEEIAAEILRRRTFKRDANNSGPVLREHQRRTGWYLATEFLTRVIGLEEYKVTHVQGHDTSAYRLREKESTAVVALMRAGEPMALGINDAFPTAMFIHASQPKDIKAHHLERLSMIILVDSVVNSGKTVVDFVHHVRQLHDACRIVIVAGVVQAEAIEDHGGLVSPLAGYRNISLVALRVSGNKYTGTNGTDTGNRLFNTLSLD